MINSVYSKRYMSDPLPDISPLALSILELLDERPMHPYELASTMRERHHDEFIRLNFGTLYHTVEMLERNGLVGRVTCEGADAAALDKMLAVAGFASAGGSPLFRLVRHEDAQGWFERLAKSGILVRRFEARPAWLRFGIAGSDAARMRLCAALGLDSKARAAPEAPRSS